MAQSARGAALRLSWRRCGDDGHCCSFLGVNLDGESLAKGGVYVIWAEDADGSRKETVYVGQGKPVLAAALSAHGSAALHGDGSASRRCCGGHDRTTEARKDGSVREVA